MHKLMRATHTWQLSMTALFIIILLVTQSDNTNKVARETFTSTKSHHAQQFCMYSLEIIVDYTTIGFLTYR